jgi:hypothetical protein
VLPHKQCRLGGGVGAHRVEPVGQVRVEQPDGDRRERDPTLLAGLPPVDPEQPGRLVDVGEVEPLQLPAPEPRAVADGEEGWPQVPVVHPLRVGRLGEEARQVLPPHAAG